MSHFLSKNFKFSFWICKWFDFISQIMKSFQQFAMIIAILFQKNNFYDEELPRFLC